MQVREIMTKDPICCTPDATLQEVARLMVKHNCGEIPVVKSPGNKQLVGVITDRDITCRAVAEGKNPLEMTASQCMSSPPLTISAEATLEECCNTMEEHKVRRLPIVSERGECCGIVAQADIARHAPKFEAAELVREVSR